MAYNDLSWRDQEPKSQRTFHAGTGYTYSDSVVGGATQVTGANACSMSANPGEVIPTGNGTRVVGQLILVDSPDSISTKATVRTHGICIFQGTGTINEGDAIVGSATAGKVRAAAPATLADVAAQRGFVIDASDINKVVVELT